MKEIKLTPEELKAAIINRYFRDNGLDPIYGHHNEKINEAKLAYMISEFEKQTKSK